MRPLRACLLALSCLLPWRADALAADQSWRFRVWLDGQEIGYHEFRLERRAEQEWLHIAARFEVRVLFLTLYEYAHENREVWEGGCLRRIESRTDANGELFHVAGALRQDRFVIDRGTDISELPACVKTFSYWDAEFLQERRLLNAQTGEWVDVEVGEPVSERLSVRGREVDAERFRLRAGEATLDLWYSSEREWLALETDTEGGRRLRYERL